MMRPRLFDAIESDFPKCGKRKKGGRERGRVRFFGGGNGISSLNIVADGAFLAGHHRLTDYWIGSRAWDRILISCFI